MVFHGLVHKPDLRQPTCDLMCGKEPKAEKTAVTAVVEKVEERDPGLRSWDLEFLLKRLKYGGNCPCGTTSMSI